MKMYKVGGCNRDELLRIPTKDIDFAVEVESFDAMRENLIAEGFEIFEERPEFFTIRAKVPADSPLLKHTKVADFVMCRKDGPSSDGRRPDFVEPGTIFDDLARRDFTINAIAKDPETDELIDPHNGEIDLHLRMLRFVGTPEDRIIEDGLRVLRGFRFLITKNLWAEAHTHKALTSELAVEMLRDISVERIVDELIKMFSHNTKHTLEILTIDMPNDMLDLLLEKGIRLKPSLKENW